MIKKLDGYIIKTFLGPFIFIFSVLFFIFIVQFAWQELDRFLGKGLSLFQILKLLFYLGITVIQLVLPLTILLASIMTFGGFGERYELAAIKSTGTSLLRVMMPLFIIVTLMAVGLFLFSNYIIPDFQQKSKNMLFNIANTKPALNFEEGKFINDIPGFAMKINKITGEENEFFEDIIIHKMSSPSQNEQTIIANNGNLKPTEDKHYLRFQLYDGYIYENNIEGKSFQDLKKQQNQIIQFDTLTKFFDISDLINKAIEQESVTDNYRFFNFSQINSKIDTLQNTFDISHADLRKDNISKVVNQSYRMDSLDLENEEYFPPIEIEELDSAQSASMTLAALNNIDRIEQESNGMHDAVKNNIKFINKIKMFQQNIITYSFTCIIFFLIGAPLGSIIRKGGIGMPVVMAIIIFVVFFIFSTLFYQASKNDLLNPILASWLPNLIILPLGLFLTIKALNDSQIFDMSNYLEPFQKFIRKFVKSKQTEHSRYQ